MAPGMVRIQPDETYLAEKYAKYQGLRGCRSICG